jgi:hypothetical protein
MPPSLPTWLSVVNFEPRLGAASVSVLPQFKVRFNTALDSDLVSTDEGLNTYVILVRMDTDDVVEVEYVSYDADNRLLTFQPSEDLSAGAFYQVTIRKSLKNAQGRAMAGDRIWSFQVDASPLGVPELSSPGDSTAYSSAPTLTWEGVTVASGTVTYEIQLDNTWTFGSDLTWESSYTVAASGASGTQELEIGVSLDEERTYYWRVRAITSEVTGEWTDAWAFWLGTTARAAPNTSASWEPEDHFTLLDLQPGDGAYHLGSWPTIRAVFSQPVSGGGLSSDVFQVWQESIDGQLGVTGASLVSGSLVADDGIVVFTPADDILPNTRYTIVVKKGLTSESGDTLRADVLQYFSGTYTPLYGGTTQVRSLHGECCDSVSTDELLYQLWRASLEVHRILLSQEPTRQAHTLTFSQVLNYTPRDVTYGMVTWCEHAAAVSVLEGHYFDLLERAGRKRTLGVWEDELSTDILPEIRAKLKELKAERDEIAANMLRAAVLSRTVQKSMLWRPELAVLDQSYTGRKTL